MTPPSNPSPSSSAGVVADGAVVTIRYSMWNDADNELLDHCDAEDALVYLQGAQNVVRGLERGLAGKRAGDQVELVLGPADAFGTPIPDAVQVVPRDEFPPDAEIEPGMVFGAFAEDDDDEEDEIAIFVLEASDTEVTVTSNHPLAGLTLRYAIEVLDVRDARPEELEHGHPAEPEEKPA